MEFLQDLFSRLRDLPELVRWAGTVGMMLIIFCETGLLVGLFLPGDSLLVTAGLLGATRPEFGIHVETLGFLLVASAIVGDSVGYTIGRFTGPKLFTREDGLIFKRKYLAKANDFYQKHGGKTVMIARFVPIVRTFAPVLAGVGAMPYARFLGFSVSGSILWIWSMLLIGYGLGRTIPGVAQHVEKVILAVIMLSVLPGVISWWRERRKSKARTTT
ncbi:MAG TPA: VTT domain-containing protein [Gemmatimonadaceae bacterium]|nr:VTT domain-containing protein [Gemmatimonadaceae bacterium]